MNRYHVLRDQHPEIIPSPPWVVVRRVALVRNAGGNIVCRHETRPEAYRCCWARNGNTIYRACDAQPVPSRATRLHLCGALHDNGHTECDLAPHGPDTDHMATVTIQWSVKR